MTIETAEVTEPSISMASGTGVEIEMPPEAGEHIKETMAQDENTPLAVDVSDGSRMGIHVVESLTELSQSLRQPITEAGEAIGDDPFLVDTTEMTIRGYTNDEGERLFFQIVLGAFAEF